MPRWINAERLYFAASFVLLAGVLYHARQTWNTTRPGQPGRTTLAGSGGAVGEADSFRLELLPEDFTALSIPEGRNIFEALDDNLPMPPVVLELPGLPALSVLAPLAIPAPPRQGRSPCRVPATLWPPVPAVTGGAEEATTGEAALLPEGDGGEPVPEEDPGDGEVEGGEEPQEAPGPPEDDPSTWAAYPGVRTLTEVQLRSGGTVRGNLLRETSSHVILDVTEPALGETPYRRSDILQLIPTRTLEEVIEGEFEAIPAFKPEAFRRLLERCLAPGTPPEVVAVAERWGDRLLQAGPPDLELVELLGTHYRSRQDIDRELACYETAVNRSGEFPAVPLLVDLARIYQRINLPELARTVLERALLHRRGYEPARVALARYHLRKRQITAAVRVLEAMGETALARTDASLVLARAHHDAGRFTSALEQLESLIGDVDRAPREALLLAGACHIALGQRLEASTILEGLCAPDPGVADACYDVGLLALLEKDAGGALQAFSRAGTLDPTSPWPALGRGFLYEMSGDLATAGSAYQEALLIQPHLGYTHLALGRIREAMGAQGDPEGYAEAMRQYQLAFVQDFELTDAIARLGFLAAAAGDRGEGHEHYREALDFLQEAARRAPEHSLVQLRIAHCQVALGELEAALKIFESLYQEDPSHGDALAGLAYVLNAQGSERRAMAYLEELAQLPGQRQEVVTFARGGARDIAVNLGRWRWMDSFSRSKEAADLQRGWQTPNEVGPRVILDPVQGVVKIAGEQAPDAPDVATRIERELESANRFVSFQATVDTSGSDRATACLSMRLRTDKRPTEFLFGRTRDGMLGYQIIDGGKEQPWEILGAYPSGPRHVLRLSLEGASGRSRYFVLEVDGRVVRDVSHRLRVARLAGGSTKGLWVGVAAAAPAFASYELVVDDVVIVEEREEP